MDRTNREIFKKLEEQHGVSKEHIEYIVKNLFKFIKEKLEEGIHDKFETFKTIRIPYFGAFYPHKKKLEHLIKRKNEKNGKQV